MDRRNKLYKLNGLETERYNQLVEAYIRERYSQSAVEAIINNYLANMNDSKYVAEFTELQEYRQQCKDRAKQEIGI